MRSEFSGFRLRHLLPGWALMNLILFAGLDWYEQTSVPSVYRLGKQARSLYQEGACNQDSPDATAPPRFRYRLMSPPQVANDDSRFPLLVFLHGSGSRGDNNLSQLRGFPEQMAQPAWRHRFPCYLFAPQCPAGLSWNAINETVLKQIHQFIEQLPIDPERIYVTGLSMGGYGSWDLIAREPTLFAGAVPICGGGDLKSADRLTQIPLWAVHGDADEVVSVDQTRQMIEAVKKAGGMPRYSELRNVGHDSWSQTYQDPNGVLKWLFEQRNRRQKPTGD